MNELNREKLYRTLTTLDIFVDKSLRLEPKSKTLSGFQYNRDLIYAATVNTYLETVGRFNPFSGQVCTNIQHLLGLPEDGRTVGEEV